VNLQTPGETKTVQKTLRKELLTAMESARTRLAVAAALEKKLTLPARWQYYLETADQMCLSIRRLRKAEDRLPPPEQWANSLERLRRTPVHAQAYQLCRVLREVVAELDIIYSDAVHK
jgi:hypothetical protein